MPKSAVMLLVLFSFAMLANATNYYVSNSGSDSNNGLSISTPFLTVHKGVASAYAGDTVFIRAGTYDEIDSRNTCADSKNCGTLYAIRSGTYDMPITFRGYPGDALPVLRGDPNRYVIYISSGIANLVYDSLEVTNGYRGITFGNAQNITIRNSHIHHLSGQTGNNNNGGIFFLFTYSTGVPSLRNVLIENNHIHHNKDVTCFMGTGAGIEMYGAYNVTIRNNLIHDEYGGIFAKGNLWIQDNGLQWEALNFLNIYNNTIYNVDSGIYFHGSNNVKVYDNLVFNFSYMGIGQSAATNLAYTNHENFSWYQNTVVGTGNYPIGEGVCFFFKNTSNTNVYNNILTNCSYRASTTSCNAAAPYDDFQREFANKGAGSDGVDLATNFKENNNIIYNPLGNYNFCWYFQPYTLAGWRSYWQTQGSNNGQFSISSDPLFYSSNNYDYHLQSTSPGKDTGAFISGFHCVRADNNPTNPYPANDPNCRHWCGNAPDIGSLEICGSYVPQPSPSVVPSPSPSIVPSPSIIPSPSPSIIPSPSPSTSPSGPECPSNWQVLHPDWVFCDDFENGNLARWDQIGTKNTITANAQNVMFGSNAMQAMLDVIGDGGSPLIKWFMPGYDEIYVRFYVKFQTGFQNLRSDGNGMHLLGILGNNINDPYSAFGNAGTLPTGFDRFTTAVDPDHAANSGALMPLMFYSYWPEMSCSGGCWGNVLRQPAPQAPLVGGQWNLVEARVKLNTIGLHDGLQELFINDVLKLSVQNMRWRDTADLRLNTIDFYSYMPNNIGTQYIYVDNVVVSRNKIGPTSGSSQSSPSPIPSSSPSPSASASPTACAPTITVDGTYSGYFSSAIDDGVVNANGDTTATWASTQDATIAHWIEKAFCNPVTINNATIWWAFNSYQNSYVTSQTVQVQYFDGSAWQTTATIPYPGANQPISTVQFSQISAQRWRLYQPAGQGAVSYNSIMWLTEIELKQAAGSASPSPSASPSTLPSASPSVIPSVSPSTIPCTENWSCTDFGACSNSTQSRACLDLNACMTTVNKPADNQSCTMPSPSPSTNASASVNPSASPIPCVEIWSCTGWTACSGGSQGRLCTDANNCGTSISMPLLMQSCAMPNNGGGNNNYNNNYYPPQTTPSIKASIKASAKPAISPTPIPVSLQVVQITQELNENIGLIPEKERLDIEDLVDQAQELQKQGKTEQALVLLKRAREKLDDLKAGTQEKKADFTTLVAALLAIIILAISIYYAKKTHGKTKEFMAPPQEREVERKMPDMAEK